MAAPREIQQPRIVIRPPFMKTIIFRIGLYVNFDYILSHRRLFEKRKRYMEILYFDKDIIVALKPSGILSQGDSSGMRNMPELLKKQTGSYYVEAVHRLDRPVSGVMVFARNKKAAGKLSADFANGMTDKEYLAVVAGRPENDVGVFKDYLFKDTAHCKSYTVKTLRRGAKEASLEYSTAGISAAGGQTVSLVKIKLHTGRTHQIRVQFSSRGMPLLGDGKYGSRIDCPLALISRRLSFRHPSTGKRLEFFCPVPNTFPWNLFKSVDTDDTVGKRPDDFESV